VGYAVGVVHGEAVVAYGLVVEHAREAIDKPSPIPYECSLLAGNSFVGVMSSSRYHFFGVKAYGVYWLKSSQQFGW
jgi:hypothetical protein